MPRPTPGELLDFLDDLAHYSTTGSATAPR
jgi:hypothetical protein